MKKFVAGIAVMCLLFTGIFSYFQISAKAQVSPSSAETDQMEEYRKALEEMPVYDAAALYAKYPADQIIGKAGSKEITWENYFQVYSGYVSEIDQQLKTMLLYYGSAPEWTEVFDETAGLTFADLPAVYTENDLLQQAVIDGFAAENGIELNEQNKAAVEEQLQSDRVTYCGENATEEDFEAFLQQNYFSLDGYREMLGRNYLYQQMFTDLYGENGTKLSNEEGISYLMENGYTAARHILFMTVNKETGETLDEDSAKEKQKVAEEIAAELKAIDDEQERIKLFSKYEEEYNEDTGRVYYPDGYIYTSGTMVQEFENAVNGLEEYEVSDPVETTYGYHVIMRIPLDAEAVVSFSDSGAPVTGKAMRANEEYGEKLQAYMEKTAISYTEDWEKPTLTDYMKRA